MFCNYHRNKPYRGLPFFGFTVSCHLTYLKPYRYLTLRSGVNFTHLITMWVVVPTLSFEELTYFGPTNANVRDILENKFKVYVRFDKMSLCSVTNGNRQSHGSDPVLPSKIHYFYKIKD